MTKVYRLFSAIIVVAALLGISSFAFKSGSNQTDTPTSGPLYNEIARLDSLMFDAFNVRNINLLKQFFDQGLELYQDNIGVRNYNETVAAFTQLFEKEYILTRKPVPGSMEVYPIKDYGAIQTGQHIFSHLENGKEETATYKFMQIWQKKEGKWRVTREITYGH
jgi:hypothetical protein